MLLFLFIQYIRAACVCEADYVATPSDSTLTHSLTLNSDSARSLSVPRLFNSSNRWVICPIISESCLLSLPTELFKLFFTTFALFTGTPLYSPFTSESLAFVYILLVFVFWRVRGVVAAAAGWTKKLFRLKFEAVGDFGDFSEGITIVADNSFFPSVSYFFLNGFLWTAAFWKWLRDTVVRLFTRDLSRTPYLLRSRWWAILDDFEGGTDFFWSRPTDPLFFRPEAIQLLVRITWWIVSIKCRTWGACYLFTFLRNIRELSDLSRLKSIISCAVSRTFFTKGCTSADWSTLRTLHPLITASKLRLNFLIFSGWEIEGFSRFCFSFLSHLWIRTMSGLKKEYSAITALFHFQLLTYLRTARLMVALALYSW